MRGVVRQLAPFIDSRSAEVAAHYFSIILSVTFRNRYFPVSLTVTFRDQRLERGPTQHARPAFFFEGVSPNRGLAGLKSRCHRHRTRPLGGDCWGRGLSHRHPVDV